MTKEQIKPGVTIVRMKGSIHSGPDCRRVEREVDDLVQAKQVHLILDLTGLTHIDSSAIGSIVKCLSALKKANGDMRIAGATGMLEGTLRLTKVDKVIGIFPTAAEAAADFPKPAV
jgi:anti-sigma B factor antagonist